ncbi:M15 family metallopeptidase [uncultured Brevundimonas sp.]|uniref:M15 family metallopeptidase n=1 Tax=uncultured Brevundimonas sp. TaxID=213418 RepID=UPI0025D81F26|nr:M15 family metallopeptidase [uncultured Brevundimonas sp.]
MMLRVLFAALGLLCFGSAGAARAQTEDCHAGAEVWAAQAGSNAVSLHTLEWTPFDRAEWGWETYLPLVQRELETVCGAGTSFFAERLAAFQNARGLPGTGVFDQATFQVLRGLWQERRPFVMARVGGACPEPPPIADLAYLVEAEEHADRLTRLLRRDVLEAYRRMAAAARAEVKVIADDPELLQIFSGFRDPEADAARCAQQGNCDGLRRAVCSPHRTGTAVDLYVGRLDGHGVDSTRPESRLEMSRGQTYRWLAANARRFGFVPYVYEPWHWEYVGG